MTANGAPVIPKRYLGDAVYAAVERGMIKLTTEDGIRETNTIYLEPEVYLELTRFWADAVAAVQAAATAPPDDGSPAMTDPPVPANTDPRFIVAEVSKNWCNGRSVADTPPLCAQFEQVIEVNRQRGYRLLTFSLHRLMARPDEMNETIIAVFEKAAHE